MWKQSLCHQCQFRKTIRSQRNSEFWLCLRHKEDPRFRKYPGQPVLRCPGYLPLEPSNR